MSVADLDVAGLPLAGSVAIEASAGTGKTYAITQLYLRMLLELDLRVEQVLVVTFTTEATHELRHRIRERLVAVLAAFDRGDTGDAFAATLLARHADAASRAAACSELRLALAGFDQAAIFTIHGFCQRVLTEQAFECRQPFAAEVGPEPRDLALAVVDDIWRRATYDASPAWADFLVARQQSPEMLLEAVWPWIDRPELEVTVPDDPGDLAALETESAAAWAEARAACARALPDVLALLDGHAGVRRSSYRRDRLPGYGDALRRWLARESPRLAGDHTPLRRFAASTLAAAAPVGATPPGHPFFETCERALQAATALHTAFDRRLRRLRHDARRTLARDLAVRKAAAGVQSFGDLLVHVAGALQAPGGEALAAAVRSRFRAALIDEFQDTDPTQWRVFRRLFADAGLPLVLVGDPKQAIYGFRGADVFTYVAARDATATRVPLARNWRSDPALVRGVNALFGRVPRPFLLDSIPFVEALPADPDAVSPLVDPADDGPPLRLWFLARESGETAVTKRRARAAIARAVAAEIARLLGAGGAPPVLLDGGPLRGSDVAVLVRSHFEAGLVRTALTALGVGCVERSHDSVFATVEAAELAHVLRAIAEPGRDGLLRAALATEMLGATGSDLLVLTDDERAWAEQAERLHAWRDLFRRRGFAPMFRAVLADAGVPERLLAFGDGERRLTNLLHLGELLQAHLVSHRLTLDGVVTWMAERQRAGSAESDEYQLRLESDAHLVQLVTVHASKGLEYPIVFCPFTWDGFLHVKTDGDLLFHPPGADRASLSFGPSHPAEHVEAARREEIAEAARLLYVALTRAKHRCTVVWGAVNDAGTSALGWLLHPPADGPVQQLGKRFDAVADDSLRADVRRLAAAVPDAVAVDELPRAPGVRLSTERDGGEALRARAFPGRVPEGWRVASFTMLTAGHPEETPDHDARRAVPPPSDPSGGILALPGRARMGSAVHEVFERWDFRTRDPQALHAIVERRLRAHGLDTAWTAVVAGMVEDVLQTALDDEGRVRLADVGRRQRLTELEFTQPLAPFRAAELARLCRVHGFAAGPIADAVAHLRFDPVQGYLRGFIDLVFEADGRWWLLDWKTNWLGPTLEEYGSERLPAVVAREGYWLQYLLYTLVVHRLLGRRVAGYDYERHFGGVFYLFVRGIRPSLGPASGVYRHRPPRALVEALDRHVRPATEGEG